MAAFLKLHRFADSVKFQKPSPKSKPTQFLCFPRLARNLQLKILHLVCLPFPLAVRAEVVRATVPTGRAIL